MCIRDSPISTPSAPRPIILSTSTPLLTPPSASIVTLPLTASAMAGSTSAAPGVQSNPLPPWFATTMAVSYTHLPFSILDPVKKNVAFTLFSSNILKTSGVLVFDVPSSKVKNTIFLPSFE